MKSRISPRIPLVKLKVDSTSVESIHTGAKESDHYVIPRGQFLRLMEASAPFRAFVFKAFGARMAEMIRLLERVAFQRVECRLAAALLFYASDFFVARDRFVRPGFVNRLIGLPLYYAAQAWFAWTIASTQ